MRTIAAALGIGEPAVHEHMRYLEAAGLAHKPGRHWIAREASPWLPIDSAPHDGEELILLCPDDQPHKVVFGSYRTGGPSSPLPLWRERYTGFVVEPVGYMRIPPRRQ